MWDRVTVKTKPIDRAVTLDELKAHCDIEYTADDDLLNGLIDAAIAKIDGVNGIGVAIEDQTWVLSFDEFPNHEFHLPGSPVKSITSIKYIDTTGTEQTLASDSYRLDISGDKARVEPSYNSAWPVARDVIGSIKVEYVLGGDNPLLKLAIKQIAAHWYENRESTIEARLMSIPMGAEQIMRDYMRGSIA